MEVEKGFTLSAIRNEPGIFKKIKHPLGTVEYFFHDTLSRDNDLIGPYLTIAEAKKARKAYFTRS